MTKASIWGTYGNGTVNLYYRYVKGAPLVVMLHGAYGYPLHSTPTRYQRLSEQLQEDFSTAYYETSRNMRWMDKPDLPFEKYVQEAFANKSFKQEKADVIAAIEEIWSRSSEFKPSMLILLGASMGGVMSFLVADQLKKIPVTSIITVGTAIRFNLPIDWPLIEDMPSEVELLNVIASYSGHLTVLHGADDDLSFYEATRSIYDAARMTKSRSICQFSNVDHRFKLLNGIEKEELLDRVIVSHIRHNVILAEI